MVVPPTEAGFEAALAAGDRLGCHEWELEGAGCYGFGLAVYAAARGLTVLEVPGLLTKRHRRQSSRRGKSDETDALAIAEVVLREGPRLSRFRPCATQRAMRLRYDQRDRHVRARTAAANRLRMAAVLLGVMALPRSLTSTRAIRKLLETARAFRADVTRHPAALALVDDMIDAAEDVERLNAKIRATDLRALVRDVVDELVELRGVSVLITRPQTATVTATAVQIYAASRERQQLTKPDEVLVSLSTLQRRLWQRLEAPCTGDPDVARAS